MIGSQLQRTRIDRGIAGIIVIGVRKNDRAGRVNGKIAASGNLRLHVVRPRRRCRIPRQSQRPVVLQIQLRQPVTRKQPVIARRIRHARQTIRITGNRYRITVLLDIRLDRA